jgi:hypothetical protein
MKIEMIQFTAFYAGLLGLFYVALSLRIIRLRWVHKVGIGHGEAKELHRAIRVHANYAEYAPFALILMLMLELNQAQDWVMHMLGSMLLIGRFLHAMGLSKRAGTSMPRFVGMVLTFMVMLIAAVMNVLVVY